MPAARATAACLLVAIASATGFGEPGSPSPGDSGPIVAYRGAVALPEDVAAADGTRVSLTGLSGIAWLGGDRYVAVMDNSARLLRLSLEIAADGAPREAADFEVVTVAAAHDYEDIAPLAGGEPGVFLCEEDTPAIHGFRFSDGAAVASPPLPAVFRGCRSNRGPEALALDPDGRHLWTANEEALEADGAAAVPGMGTVVRLARLPLTRGAAAFEAAYRVDPPHACVEVLPGPTLSGVVAIVPLGGGRLLVLERSGRAGLPPFENRIYRVDTAGARDVSRVARGLADRPETMLDKTLLWSGALGINIEGLCLGPKLAGGRRALVAIADNGGLGTPTQVAGFELSAVTNP